MEHHSVMTKVVEFYCAKCWAFFLQVILDLENPATENENRKRRINVVESVVAGFVKVGDVIRRRDHDTSFPGRWPYMLNERYNGDRLVLAYRQAPPCFPPPS